MPSFTVYKGSKGGAIKKETTTKPDELTGDQVLVKVTASGLCGTDLHYREAGIALGHEGAGVIEAVGPDAKHLKKGDRVGWGYLHESCGYCEHCLTGWETFCPQRQMYAMANTDQGSFATHAIWREAYVFKLPDELTDAEAAPLQCGGATVFNALHDVKSNDVVGVMGVGGLGHLAIQFAAKLGCRVVVLSGSDRKRDEALKLGAHEFIATKGAEELKTSHPITRLVVTTSAQPEWAKILPILAPRASIYPLSVDQGDFKIPYMPLLIQGIQVQGSIVAARNLHRKMLDFAALHQIKPVIQTFPMSEQGIEEAMGKLEKGEITYRAVLLNDKQ